MPFSPIALDVFFSISKNRSCSAREEEANVGDQRSFCSALIFIRRPLNVAFSILSSSYTSKSV